MGLGASVIFRTLGDRFPVKQKAIALVSCLYHVPNSVFSVSWDY